MGFLSSKTFAHRLPYRVQVHTRRASQQRSLVGKHRRTVTILPTASRFLLGLYASVPQVVGGHLPNKLRKPIYALTRSKSLWEHRIAILSTLHFIRFGDFGDALAISLKLLKDQEDLIHKASGWMLRED